MTACPPKQPQNQKKDHPAPSLMETSRINEVKTTRRSVGRRLPTSTCLASKTSRFLLCFALFASSAAAIRFSAFSRAILISSFFLAFLTCVRYDRGATAARSHSPQDSLTAASTSSTQRGLVKTPSRRPRRAWTLLDAIAATRSLDAVRSGSNSPSFLETIHEDGVKAP